MSNTATIALVIVGVFAISALAGLMAWRFLQTALDPRRVRRRLFVFGSLYFWGAFEGVSEVIRGEAPIYALFGLPIALTLAAWYLRTACRYHVPNK